MHWVPRTVRLNRAVTILCVVVASYSRAFARYCASRSLALLPPFRSLRRSFLTYVLMCCHRRFRTEPPGALRPTTAWPIQNFHWSDIDVPLGAAVSYQLVPMVVAPASQQTTAVSAVMEPLEALATAWTEPVVLEVSGETQVL